MQAKIRPIPIPTINSDICRTIFNEHFKSEQVNNVLWKSELPRPDTISGRAVVDTALYWRNTMFYRRFFGANVFTWRFALLLGLVVV
jgi:hypothetical protein